MANNLLHGGTTNDEGFKSLSEELFEQIFRANPDMSLNGTVIAAINAKKSNAEILEQHVKDKDEDEDLTAQMIEAGETVISMREESLRREREEWSNSEHELGGITMTGEEWARLGDAMQNDEKTKSSQIAYLIRQGLTPDQAKQKQKEFADAVVATGKADCDKTPADKAAIDKAKNDPNFKATIEVGQQKIESGRDFSAPVVQKAQIVQSKSVSTAIGADILSGENSETNNYKKDDFKNAPSLKTNYEAAQIAVTPLDNPNYSKDQNIGAVANVQKTANAIAAQSPDGLA